MIRLFQISFLFRFTLSQKEIIALYMIFYSDILHKNDLTCIQFNSKLPCKTCLTIILTFSKGMP